MQCNADAAPPHFLQSNKRTAACRRLRVPRKLERRLQLSPWTNAKGVRMARRKMDWEDPAVSPDELLKGHDVRSLGPGDSSDTGADMMGLGRGDDTSDRFGTGERASVEDDPRERYAADIATDRVVAADGAGLGGGLDQAEEAQLGITDEELSELDFDDE
jgi:hypothetical protein